MGYPRTFTHGLQAALPVHRGHSMTLNGPKLLGLVPVCLCLKSIGNMLFHVWVLALKVLMRSVLAGWATERLWSLVQRLWRRTGLPWSQVSASRPRDQIRLAYGLRLNSVASLCVCSALGMWCYIYVQLSGSFWIWFDWILIVTSTFY